MAEFKRGATAGLIAGVIFGVILAVMGVVYVYATLAPGYVIRTERVIGLIIGYAIAGGVAEIIFGAVYTVAYKNLLTG